MRRMDRLPSSVVLSILRTCTPLASQEISPLLVSIGIPIVQ